MQPTSAKRIFLAGATGAIGRRLCRLLAADGYIIIGTTRNPEKAAMLQSLGVTPVVVDVFDAQALRQAVLETRPQVVIHQLTDLPPGLDPRLMAEARARNARLWEVGTKNLVAAAVAAGVERLIAQSLAFVYAPGPLPYIETAPLDVASSDAAVALSARAVASLEHQVLNGPFTGIVLRYGKLYGQGTGFDVAPAGGVHVDAAADAARLAMTRGEAGIYNIAEEDGTVSCAKARTILGWNSSFRLAASAV
jgi:nucleoside-diphosphate-sugar epimerase